MDFEAQKDEIIVLGSIYENCFNEYESSDVKGGNMIIHLDLPETNILSTEKGAGGKLENYEVQHLPPVYLHFTYPLDYPSKCPPTYTLSCKWITREQLTRLCKELDRLWQENEGDVVVYTWAQYIKEETMSLLGLSSTLNVDLMKPKRTESAMNGNHSTRSTTNKVPSDTCKECQSALCECQSSDTYSTSIPNECDVSNTPKLLNSSSKPENEASSTSADETAQSLDLNKFDERTIQDIGRKASLLVFLRDYNQEMQKRDFDKKMFSCDVCFCEKIGTACIEFWPCGHVYCKECMKGYFEVQIKEGNVKFLICPNAKCKSEANPKQVEELVEASLYEKYDRMLLSTTLSSLGDTQPCPRMHCQYPVTIDNSQGYCPSCSFVFCALCRFGEHGVEPCKLQNSEARRVIDDYMNGDAAHKKSLELRFGKRYLVKMQDEFMTMNYLGDNAKRCPSCGTNIEKYDGCNKMTCQRCGAHFCWLCMAKLDTQRPYSHFNNLKSVCFQRLFEGVDDDEEEEDDEEFDIFEREWF